MATLPYPGVATDYKPLLMSVLAVSDGVYVADHFMGELAREYGRRPKRFDSGAML